MTEQNEPQGVQYEGILSKGFGLIPQMVTRDKTLSIEAKAIYAYLAAFAGNDQKAFPGVALICDELNISKKRYLSHRKALIERGYIEIKRERLESGFSKNIYVLKQDIPYGVVSLPYDSLPYQNVGLRGVTVQNDPTNINSSNKNIFNKNSINKQQTDKQNMAPNEANLFAEIVATYEKCFGLVSPFVGEELDYIFKSYSKDLINEAIKETAQNKNVKKPIKYITKILTNWHNENIRSLHDLEVVREEREQNGKNDRGSISSSESKKPGKYAGLSNYNSGV